MPQPQRKRAQGPGQRLLKAAREQNLVIFAGAGISMSPPTALPSWWDLSAAVVQAIAARAANIVDDSQSLAKIVISRQQSESFPPDYVAEKIVNTIREKYFEVLRCIDSNQPNANHLALAELAAAGKLRAILTTNFDRTIEAAFAVRGIPVEVIADPESAQGLLARWSEFEGGQLPCQLLKLHGTADRPDTVIDTLAQRARGTPPVYLDCIHKLLAFGAWGFIGFSGADLETQPDYLGLRRAAADGRGISWLVESGKKPRAAVSQLIKDWKEKAEVIEGTLPDVLNDLLEGTSPRRPSRAKTIRVDVSQAAQTWAREIPEQKCALIIAELVDGTGETSRARAALEQLAATYPEHQWKLASGWQGDTLVLRASKDDGPLTGQPLAFGDRNNPAVVGLVSGIDQAQPQWENYAHTLYGLSDVLDRLGEKSAAGEMAKRSILFGLFARLGRTLIVRGLGVLADLRASEAGQEAHAEADRLYAAAIREAEPGARIRANLLVNRGRNAMRMGGEKAAFGTFMQATEIFQTLGDEHGRAGVGLALADLSAGVGDYRHALLFWQDVLEFAHRVGDEPFVFEAALGTGKVYRQLAEKDRARTAFAEALRAAKALRDSDRESTATAAIESLGE